MPKAKIIGKQPREYHSDDGKYYRSCAVYYTYESKDNSVEGVLTGQAVIPSSICPAEDIKIGDIVIVAKTTRTYNGQSREVIDTYELLDRPGGGVKRV